MLLQLILELVVDELELTFENAVILVINEVLRLFANYAMFLLPLFPSSVSRAWTAVFRASS